MKASEDNKDVMGILFYITINKLINYLLLKDNRFLFSYLYVRLFKYSLLGT